MVKEYIITKKEVKSSTCKFIINYEKKSLEIKLMKMGEGYSASPVL